MIELSTENFDNIVVENPLPVIVDFYAHGAAPAK
jgi:hypothetical protein